MKKVCILCRGESLLDINKIPDDAVVYITVNRFADEFKDTNIANKLKNKDLHHMTSLSPNELKSMIDDDCFIQYNYIDLVVPYLSETIPNSVPVIDIGNLKLLTGKVMTDKCKQFMYKRGERPDGNERYAYSFPTSGIAAVCYATVDLEADDIHIIGLDFYQAKYAYGLEFKDVEQSLKRGEDPSMMKQFFTDFVKKFPEKIFNLYTKSPYNENLDNLNVYNL